MGVNLFLDFKKINCCTLDCVIMCFYVPIINISNIENNTELETDFCIIGAGMSGQIVASKN